MWFATLAITAGAAIALQAGMNAQLGILLRNSLLATAIVFGISCLVTTSAAFAMLRQPLSYSIVQTVPFYLWFGGLLSAFGVGMFYFLIPRMGVGQMMSFALTGQILVAMISSHFGWFDLPQRPVTPIRGLGVVALAAGILLINWE